MQMEDEARHAAFAALPIEEQVLEVLDALTAADATQKQLMAPREEPEEWTAEVSSAECWCCRNQCPCVLNC